MHIAAAPEAVFPYFTGPGRDVQWMGNQAIVEPARGGTYHVQMAGGFARRVAWETLSPPARHQGCREDPAPNHHQQPTSRHRPGQ